MGVVSRGGLFGLVLGSRVGVVSRGGMFGLVDVACASSLALEPSVRDVVVVRGSDAEGATALGAFAALFCSMDAAHCGATIGCVRGAEQRWRARRAIETLTAEGALELKRAAAFKVRRWTYLPSRWRVA